MVPKALLPFPLPVLLPVLLTGLLVPGTAPAATTEVVGDDPGLHRLAAEIERLSLAAEGTVGVSVIHLESGRAVHVNGEERFPMASTYKVPIAVEILSRIDAGERSLDDRVTLEEGDLYTTAGFVSDYLSDPGAQLTLQNLLGLMLRISDNNATDVLFREAGGSQAITARMQAIGAAGIRVDRPTWAIIANWLGRWDVTVANPIHPRDFAPLVDPARLAAVTPDEQAELNRAFNADPQDTATPRAMATLLGKIFNGEVLSKQSSALLVDIMERCETGAARLPGRLPPGTTVAHKTGTIGETTNDVGVVYLPGEAGHVVTVVYIKESKLGSNEAMEPVIAEIARAAYDYFVFHPE